MFNTLRDLFEKIFYEWKWGLNYNERKNKLYSYIDGKFKNLESDGENEFDDD